MDIHLGIPQWIMIVFSVLYILASLSSWILADDRIRIILAKLIGLFLGISVEYIVLYNGGFFTLCK